MIGRPRELNRTGVIISLGSWPDASSFYIHSTPSRRLLHPLSRSQALSLSLSLSQPKSANRNQTKDGKIERKRESCAGFSAFPPPFHRWGTFSKSLSLRFLRLISIDPSFGLQGNVCLSVSRNRFCYDFLNDAFLSFVSSAFEIYQFSSIIRHFQPCSWYVEEFFWCIAKLLSNYTSDSRNQDSIFNENFDFFSVSLFFFLNFISGDCSFLLPWRWRWYFAQNFSPFFFLSKYQKFVFLVDQDGGD